MQALLWLAIAGLAADRGATVPYVTYEAEDGVLGGGAKLLNDQKGDNRAPGTFTGEASGRQAVYLGGTGDYVEWKATNDANAFVVRHSVPTMDQAATTTLSLAADGVKIGSFTITTRFGHLCGSISDPQKCQPGQNGFHIYDDARLLLTTTVKAGQTVRVYKDGSDSAAYYVIDFLDLELVSPKPKPDGFEDITAYGAKEGSNASPAIKAAVAAAVEKKSKGVWIPAGVWLMDNIEGATDTGKIQLPAAVNSHPTKFEIAGAGMWYSWLKAVNPGNDDWGRNWGFDCQGQTVYYHDFGMEGENRIRTEGGKPLVNGYGENTEISNLWIEHSTIGFWVGGAMVDFPAGITATQRQSKGLHIHDSRVRNTGADGINLCAGTTAALVENVNARSNGDDAFAMWSEQDGWVSSDAINPGGCQDNVIKFCTSECTWRANALGLYGGKNNKVQDCIFRDTLTYHGIDIDGKTFQCAGPSGTVTVERCSLIRTSGTFWAQYWPAIGVYSNVGQTVVISDITVDDTWYGALGFRGESQATFNNIQITDYCQSGIPYSPCGGTFGCTPNQNGDARHENCFLFCEGTGSFTFNNVNQKGYGNCAGAMNYDGQPEDGCAGFFGYNKLSDAYHVGADCNWDANGPK